jgi:transcriptional regulator with PAS, ATPase and Fis domain
MYSIEKGLEIRKGWEEFFYHDKLPSIDIREEILNSWIRCKQLDVPFDFTEIDVPCITSKNLEARLRKMKPIIDIVTPYLIKLFSIIKESECIVAFANNEGIILKSISDDNVLKKFPARSATPGKIFSERMAGTNAIGTSLYLNKPIQIWAAEHYNIQSHDWVCSGAPIHDPGGNIIGCLLISGLATKANIFSLGMVASSVDAIEAQLKIENYVTTESTYNNELRHALNHVSEGVIVINNFDQIAYINDYCKEMLGIRNMQLIGQPLGNIIENFKDIQHLLQSSRADAQYAFKIKTASRLVKCNLSGIKYYNDNNEFQGYIIYISPAEQVSKLLKQRSISKASFTFDHIIGSSPSLEKAREHAKVASNSDSSVLIIGESGTGKELFAQAIHNYSNRRNGPFVAVNCGAIPISLIESELFGYSGGAFTGAKKEGQPGKFELADGGTIFLDEVGDMPLDIQVALLRVLQEKEVVRVGGKNTIHIDVRVIAATNKDLSQAIVNQEFRIDLFYRLNIFQINIPPLRERGDDITHLANFFVSKYSSKLGKNIYGLDEDCISILLKHPWPGNVRELENTIERAVNFSNGNYITPADIILHELSPIKVPVNVDHPHSAKNSASCNSKTQLIEYLEMYEGNISQVANQLGCARKTIYARIKKYDIDIEEFRLNE